MIPVPSDCSILGWSSDSQNTKIEGASKPREQRQKKSPWLHQRRMKLLAGYNNEVSTISVTFLESLDAFSKLKGEEICDGTTKANRKTESDGETDAESEWVADGRKWWRWQCFNSKRFSCEPRTMSDVDGGRNVYVLMDTNQVLVHADMGEKFVKN